jgi:hypothetical protein
MRRAVEDPFDHEKWGEKLFVRGYWGRGESREENFDFI